MPRRDYRINTADGSMQRRTRKTIGPMSQARSAATDRLRQGVKKDGTPAKWTYEYKSYDDYRADAISKAQKAKEYYALNPDARPAKRIKGTRHPKGHQSHKDSAAKRCITQLRNKGYVVTVKGGPSVKGEGVYYR